MTDQELAQRDPLWKAYLDTKRDLERKAADASKANNEIAAIEYEIFSREVEAIASFLDEHRGLFIKRAQAVEREVQRAFADPYWAFEDPLTRMSLESNKTIDPKAGRRLLIPEFELLEASQDSQRDRNDRHHREPLRPMTPEQIDVITDLMGNESFEWVDGMLAVRNAPGLQDHLLPQGRHGTRDAVFNENCIPAVFDPATYGGLHDLACRKWEAQAICVQPGISPGIWWAAVTDTGSINEEGRIPETLTVFPIHIAAVISAIFHERS